VGKETDRRWEQGEDLSLVEFTSFEYQQSKQVVAGEDIKQDILKTGIRKLERGPGVSHHTLERILRGESVRRKTLAKIVKQLQLYRETAQTELVPRSVMAMLRQQRTYHLSLIE
jgi:predicted transcriptional regulator